MEHPENRGEGQLLVVIPAYNCEKTLQRAVRSVRSQPWAGARIILVNDGSTDGTGALCDRIAGEDPLVTVIHKENGGVSSARNCAVEYALSCAETGYIAFLDGDDFWCPDAVDSALLQSVLEDGADMVAFGGFRCDAAGARFSRPYDYAPAIRDGGNGAIWSLKGQFVANLYGISLLREYSIRFQEGLKYSEDVIFRLQCAFLSRKIRYVPQLLYCYYENSSSAMSKVLQIPPIDYYRPIIDGWMRSDAFVNSFTEQTGRTCRAGRILAGIYLMDMAMDHFKRGRDRKTILRELKEHPHRHTFEQMRPEDVSPRQYRDHLLLKNRPVLFEIKYRILGLAERAARLAASTAPGRALRNRLRYPLEQMPENPGRG